MMLQTTLAIIFLLVPIVSQAQQVDETLKSSPLGRQLEFVIQDFPQIKDSDCLPAAAKSKLEAFLANTAQALMDVDMASPGQLNVKDLQQNIQADWPIQTSERKRN